FQITHSALLNLRPQESETIRFTFRVPSQVADGAEFCIDGVFAGRWPTAFFDPVGSLTGLFCIVKGISSFSLRAADAPRGVGVKGTGTTRPKGAGPKRIIPNGARMRP